MKIRYIVIFTAFLALSCGGPVVEECIEGEPIAIFDPGMKGITAHSFETKENKATESFLATIQPFVIDVEILQSGCETIVQEFRFNVREVGGQVLEFADAKDCAGFVAEILLNLSGLSEKEPGKLIALFNLGNAIGQKVQSFEYNEPIQLIDGEPFTVQIDQIRNPKSVLLMVVYTTG